MHPLTLTNVLSLFIPYINISSQKFSSTPFHLLFLILYSWPPCGSTPVLPEYLLLWHFCTWDKTSIFWSCHMSMCPVLKLKNIISWKYSPISTISALQKAKGLTWGFFLIKTPMFIECLLLHRFLSWPSMIHTSMKLLSLSMQVIASFPSYSVSLISLLSLPSKAGREVRTNNDFSLFTSNAKMFPFQVS